MDIHDKTLYTTKDENLKMIYQEELQKLRENEFKLRVLQELTVEDFPNELSESSKSNIDKALLSIKIRDHISLGNGQKVLGELKTKTRRICLD